MAQLKSKIKVNPAPVSLGASFSTVALSDETDEEKKEQKARMAEYIRQAKKRNALDNNIAIYGNYLVFRRRVDNKVWINGKASSKVVKHEYYVMEVNPTRCVTKVLLGDEEPYVWGMRDKNILWKGRMGKLDYTWDRIKEMSPGTRELTLTLERKSMEFGACKYAEFLSRCTSNPNRDVPCEKKTKKKSSAK